MNVFVYDGTFEGVLTAVFEAYERKLFPDSLVAEGEMLPLFYDNLVPVTADVAKADRVWRALQKKLSPAGLSGSPDVAFPVCLQNGGCLSVH